MEAASVVILVAILVASAVIAFAFGRWWTLAVPIAAVSVFYVGLNAEWWGYGLGDGWQFAVALVMGVGVLAAALGLIARAVMSRRSGDRRVARGSR